MVDLEAHCYPPATILDEGGVTLELVSSFLVTLGTSSCFSSLTVWASYRVDPDGPVFCDCQKSYEGHQLPDETGLSGQYNTVQYWL